jgi:hypothetical protein
MRLHSAAVVALLVLQAIPCPVFDGHGLQAIRVVKLEDTANLLTVLEASI